MHKIRLLNAKDRSRIYEIMQQDDILTAFEIDFTIEQIDNFLFENNKLKNKAIVIENDNCRVIGFGYYGPNDVIRDSFIIYRFYLSSIYDDNTLADELISFIEKDINSKHIRKIYMALTSKISNKKLQFYKKHNYIKEKIQKDFYKKGKDLVLLEKDLNSTLNTIDYIQN